MQTLNIKLTAHQLIMLELLLKKEARKLEATREQLLEDGNAPESTQHLINYIKDMRNTEALIGRVLKGEE